MKRLLPLLLLLASSLPGADTFRLKNSAGKIVVFEVESVAADVLVGYVKNDTAKKVVKWKDLDLDWLRTEEPALHKRYLAAVREAEACKDYDPTEDVKKSVLEITQRMSGVKVPLSEFSRDEAGKVIRVKPKAEPLDFARTYDYLNRIIANEGDDGRKTYYKNRNTSDFRSDAKAMDAKLLNLSTEIDRMVARLETLPNIKVNPKNKTTLEHLHDLSDSAKKLRTDTNALDRTACEKIKLALEYFKKL